MARNTKLAGRNGKLLSFEQTGEHYYRTGLAKLDKNDLVGAMANYRLALERDPQNKDIVLSMAEVLTGMEKYDESNRLLLTHFRDGKKCPTEVYFGMGCNFMALHEYDCAISSFDKYLDEDPEGEFAYEAYDMAEMLDDEDGEFVASDAPSKERAEAEEGRRMLERGDFKGAIAALRSLSEKYPDMYYARNALALALYCEHNYDSATKEVGAVLNDDPSNLQAHCNLAVFMRGAKDETGLKREIEFLKAAKPDTDDDINAVGVTLLEMHEYESALPHLKKLAQKLPYNEEVRHRLGVCAYGMGSYALAQSCYDRLLQMDKNDAVARYYRNLCRLAINGAPKHPHLMISYQVPLDEMVLRIRRLNELVHLPHDELKKLWYPGSELESLIKWSFTIGDDSIKRAMLGFIALFRDANSENALRDFVLRRDQSMDLKRDALGYLKDMGAEEPYLSYIDGELMESHVNLMPVMPDDMPKQYASVMESCAACMRGVRSDECIMKAAKLWSEYVASLDGYRPLTGGQEAAFAAVLEYSACRELGQSVTKWELCSKYGITVARFNGAFAKFSDWERSKK